MSRYNTQVLSSIRMLCRMQNIDEKVLYERAKLILSIYREVCWSTIDRANDVCDTLICTYGELFNNWLHFIKIMKSVLFIELALRHISVKLELFNADITYAGNPAAA